MYQNLNLKKEDNTVGAADWCRRQYSGGSCLVQKTIQLEQLIGAEDNTVGAT